MAGIGETKSCKNLVGKAIRKDHLREIGVHERLILELVFNKLALMMWTGLSFKRRIKSRLPFAGIIRSAPYSPRFQDKG